MRLCLITLQGRWPSPNQSQTHFRDKKGRQTKGIMASQDTETDNPAPVKAHGEEKAGGDNEVGDGGGDAAPVTDGTAVENPSATDGTNPSEVKIEGAVDTAGGDGGGASNAAAAEGGTGGDKGDDSKADVEDDAPKTFPQVVRTVSRSEVLYLLDFFLGKGSRWKRSDHGREMMVHSTCYH